MTDFHENDQPRDTIRKRKRAGYQADYRQRLKDDKVPDREDVAAACLRRLLAGWVSRPDAGKTFRRGLLDDLAGRFSREEAERVLDAMIDRARKAHHQHHD